MDTEQLRAFEETAHRFARREIDPMTAGPGRDGELSMVPRILDRAEAVGLLPSPDPQSPGHDFGIWGKACQDAGPGFSLVLLQEIAKSCAGVAYCLHATGLGALEAAPRPSGGRQRISVALLEEGWRFGWGALSRPPEEALHFQGGLGQYLLEGSKTFVYLAPGWTGLVVYGRGHKGWARAYVPRNSQGLQVLRVGRRTGLAAAEVCHVSLSQTPVPTEHCVQPGSPLPFLTRHMLGLAAIATGNALGALETARSYARERYQGGEMIEGHPAILMLLGEAASRAIASRECLRAMAGEVRIDREELWRAFCAKLRVTTDCCDAVSDCMQVLGGYGYMEDYRIEKRLRDAMTLKTLWPRPDELKMLCGGFFSEGAP